MKKEIVKVMTFIDDPYSIVCYIREDYFHKFGCFRNVTDQQIYHEVKLIVRGYKLRVLTNKIKNNKNEKC